MPVGLEYDVADICELLRWQTLDRYGASSPERKAALLAQAAKADLLLPIATGAAKIPSHDYRLTNCLLTAFPICVFLAWGPCRAWLQPCQPQPGVGAQEPGRIDRYLWGGVFVQCATMPPRAFCSPLISY